MIKVTLDVSDVGIPYCLVDDVLDTHQQNAILEEFDSLSDRFFTDPTKTAGAVTEDNKHLKNTKAVFLNTLLSEGFYKNAFDSPSVNLPKLIFNENIYKTLLDHHVMWHYFNLPNFNVGTQYLYYENSAYYKKHRDAAIYTLLYWYNREPLSFTGGGLTLGNNTKVAYRSNRFILFPSILEHEVDPVRLNPTVQSSNTMMGRICVSNFLKL